MTTKAKMRKRERWEDSMILVSYMKEGATNEGMQIVFRSWKRERKG